MDLDPSWMFDEYWAYEQARFNESQVEQERAAPVGWGTRSSAGGGVGHQGGGGWWHW
jgi:hypothetical protein